MNTRKRIGTWAVLVILGFTALVWFGLNCPPVPRVKARASRIAAVNIVSGMSFTLTNSSALHGARSGAGK